VEHISSSSVLIWTCSAGHRELRAIGLRIDRLEEDMFDIFAPLRPVGLGIEVDAFRPSHPPASRRSGNRGWRACRIDIVRFGEDVFGEGIHRKPFSAANMAMIDLRVYVDQARFLWHRGPDRGRV